jgi:5'-nucleotidase
VIRTYTGRLFDLLEPKPEDVDIIDIAQSLSRLVRFTGHAGAYTVAEHALHVEWAVGLLSDGLDAKRLYRRCARALHHDDSEAYTNDVSAPLKRAMRELSPNGLSVFDVIEMRIQTAVLTALGLDDAGDDSDGENIVHRVDGLLCAMEQRAFMPKSEPTGDFSQAVMDRLQDPFWRRADTRTIEGRFLERADQLSRQLHLK